jgi:predicted MPP superfamily phosphohydrolase
VPFSVFGRLGKHKVYTETQDWITRLFKKAEIRILRLERATIQSHGENLSMVGVDFQGRQGPPLPSKHTLRGVQLLILSETINILLSHDPNSFDCATQFGIDLSLEGHTHGGQLARKFIHGGLNLSHGDYP